MAEECKETSVKFEQLFDEICTLFEDVDTKISERFAHIGKLLQERENSLYDQLRECRGSNCKVLSVYAHEASLQKQKIVKAMSYHKPGYFKKIPLVQMGMNYNVFFNPPDIFFGQSFQSRYICFHISRTQSFSEESENDNDNGRVYLGAYSINRSLSALRVSKFMSNQSLGAQIFDSPRGICVRPTTGEIFMVNSKSGIISVFSPKLMLMTEVILTAEEICRIGKFVADGDEGNENEEGGFGFMKRITKRWSMSTPDQQPRAAGGPSQPRQVKRFSPIDIAFEKSGRQFAVVDQSNDCVVIFDENNRLMFSIGSKGNSKYQFDGPICVDYDSQGNIHVSDSKNNRIQRFTSNGKYIQSISFGKLKQVKKFRGGVYGLRIRNDQIYATISDAPVLAVLTPTGQFLRYFDVEELTRSWVGFSPWNGFFIYDQYSKFHFYDEEGPLKKKVVIKMPGGAAFSANHQLIVSNYIENSVSQFDVDMNSNSIEFLVNSTSFAGKVLAFRIRPRSISIHPITQYVYSIDNETNLIHIFSAQLHHIETFKPRDVTLSKPQSMSFSNDGEIMVITDSSSRFVSIFDQNGELISNSAMNLPDEVVSLIPGGVVVDHAGNIHVMDSTHSFIFKFDSKGKKLCHTAIEPRLTDKRNYWPMLINDENELVLCIRDRKVLDVYSTSTLELIRSIDHPFGRIAHLTRGPNLTMAVCGLSKDPKCPQSILFCDMKGTILKTIDVHEASSMIFNSQGRLFITKPGGLLEY